MAASNPKNAFWRLWQQAGDKYRTASHPAKQGAMECYSQRCACRRPFRQQTARHAREQHDCSTLRSGVMHTAIAYSQLHRVSPLSSEVT